MQLVAQPEQMVPRKLRRYEANFPYESHSIAGYARVFSWGRQFNHLQE